MKTASLLLVILFLAVLTVPAQGFLISAMGDPVEGNSWSARWRLAKHEPTSMNMFRVDILPDSDSQLFAMPGLSGFSGPGSWSRYSFTPTTILAAGVLNPGETVFYDMTYATNQNEPIHFYLSAYENSEWRGSLFITRDSEFIDDLQSLNSGWWGKGMAQSDWNPGNPIPEPATLLLLGLGMVSMVAVRRFRRSK